MLYCVDLNRFNHILLVYKPRGEWNIVSHCKRFNLSMILLLVEKQQILILSSGLTSDQTQDLHSTALDVSKLLFTLLR
jgi:hypothetical protein